MLKKDHPRRCGENRKHIHVYILHMGSPPQVRGKPAERDPSAFFTRITPAGAGKTYLDMPDWAKAEDHPRRCGENSIFFELHFAGEGSPPQVRGKPIAAMISGSAPRITPAGAGKTSECRTDSGFDVDHPRRCGENALSTYRMSAEIGSPPQVRGKHSERTVNAKGFRITPAGAGKTRMVLYGGR